MNRRLHFCSFLLSLLWFWWQGCNVLVSWVTSCTRFWNGTFLQSFTACWSRGGFRTSSVVTPQCSDCNTVLSCVLSYLGTSLGYRMFYFGIKKKINVHSFPFPLQCYSWEDNKRWKWKCACVLVAPEYMSVAVSCNLLHTQEGPWTTQLQLSAGAFNMLSHLIWDELK